MNRRTTLALVATTLLMASCANLRTKPPTETPKGENRFLVDPRMGYSQKPSPAVEKRFETAWRSFIAGDYVDALRRFGDIRSKNPEYLPAELGEAAVEIAQGKFDSALALVQRAEDRAPDYTAARIYEAEIAAAQHRTRSAYDIYRSLSLRPDAPPTVAERVNTLQNQLFEELFAAAQTAPDEEAIRLLREALTINAGASNARVLLAHKLIARKQFEEARQVLDPLLSSADFDKTDVQEALAEIEVGRGQYEQAIARYERLFRLNRDARYAHRLEQIKQEFNAANMPPQVQRAIESEAIDRSDFAVLLYWKVTSVRFAQNLGIPPIAIDIEGVPGREEMIRAIAIGLYDVDPVTRRVSPLRPINTATLTRLAARVLLVRGASCARAVPYERDESARAEKVLAACGVSDPSGGVAPDAPVGGRAAAALLDQIERILGR
ncbi:MAG TPA: tetratricopeptide repeat protein [Thermoanaerobaculia bacterium]|nr:tetratricopeptide repeat protein [Thermoanaerobaculia bacterium]